MALTDALRISRERNLDLIQVTEKVEPPVCKMMDYGKYLYLEQKKQKQEIKKQRSSSGQLKQVRLSFRISLHDLEVRAAQAEKFLKRGDKVMIGMVLRGREKALGNFAKEKINKFIEILKESVPLKIERELKREPRGFTMIVAREGK